MSRRPIKVLLMAPVPPPMGGIGHWTSIVSEYSLQRKDVIVSVLNTSPTWRSIHSIGLLFRSLVGGAQLLIDLARLIFTLSKTKYDVIHLTTSGSLAVVRDLSVSVIGSLFNVSVVYHVHFGRIPKIADANDFEWRLIKKVMARSSTVIVLDRPTFSSVKRYAPCINVLLVPNCINVDPLPSIDPRIDIVKTVLFIGWVVPTKGIEELVKSWSMVNRYDWRLDIVGSFEPWYRDQLMEQYQSNSVNFIGHLPHAMAMERMSRCDLFVLPSYTEGFPNVILEAMVFGRAIIATDVGAIPEILEDGAGILFKSQSVEALTEVLNKVLSDSELRKSIGMCANKKVFDHFTVDIVFDAYMKIWQGASGIK